MLDKITKKIVLVSASLIVIILIILGVFNMHERDEIVILETNYGEIHIELFKEEAPITSNNFLNYVKEGFYDGLVFHRVIDGFMVQGGGFTQQMVQKETKEPIQLETDPDLKNLRGTIAMARTNDPHSATSQFFINVVDNPFLDARAGNLGYAVFGKVISGMEVVDKIKEVETETKGGHQNWPVEPVIIERVYVR